MNRIKLSLFCCLLVVIMITSCSNGGGSNENKSIVRREGDSSLRIAFVYSDSIIANYGLANEMRDKITAEGSKLEKSLMQKQKQFENDAKYFQESVNKNALSEQSAQEIYAQLSIKEQELYGLREQYTMQIAQKEMEMNVELLKSVNDFLKDYAEDNGWDFILNYSAGGAIFYGNNAFDITDEVMVKLNDEYNKSIKDKK